MTAKPAVTWRNQMLNFWLTCRNLPEPDVTAYVIRTCKLFDIK